jgi:hypothetical protein
MLTKKLVAGIALGVALTGAAHADIIFAAMPSGTGDNVHVADRSRR